MFEISELFRSIEGEGPYSGRTTIYARVARCNFKCPLFNNHNKEITEDGYAPIKFVPADYNTLQEIPIIEMGCDSQYSVSPAFAHMWKKMTTEELAQGLCELLPATGWTGGTVPTILSLTGGEPTLRWKQIIELINHPLLSDVKHILVETNCAVPINQKFIDAIKQWLSGSLGRRWTWSNSPKLTSSGEVWKKAIRPEIAEMQQQVVISDLWLGQVQADQYFKFVCGPDQADFDEVKKAMAEYHAGGILKTAPVYIMPASAILEQQQQTSKQVAEMCMQQGFIYCHRVHLDVYGNAIGT